MSVLKTRPITNYIGIWLMFYLNITCGLALISQEKMIVKCVGLAGYVGITDLTKAGDLIRGRTYEAFMPLIAVAIVYLVMVMIFSSLVGVLERRLRRNER